MFPEPAAVSLASLLFNLCPLPDTRDDLDGTLAI